MSLLRVFATCMILCVLSSLQLQAQMATGTNWNLWLLNPADPRNPLEQADGVNDNRTVVGLSYPLSSKLMPPYWGFVHYFSGKVPYWHPANAKKSWFTGRNNVGNTVGNYIDT